MQAKLERRKFGRRQTYQPAWLLVTGRPRTPCQVRNYSPKGAFIEIDAPSWLPFRFQLRIEGVPEPVTCEIRHVTKGGIGVNFCADGLGGTIGTVDAADAELASWIGSVAGVRSLAGSRR